MDKTAFLEQSDAPRTVARAAWKAAVGNPELASSLLEPAKLKIQGKFNLVDQPFGGLVYITWNFLSNSFGVAETIVSGSRKILDVPVELPARNFIDRIRWGNQSGLQMSGNTRVLQAELTAALEDGQSELFKVISSGDVEKFKAVFSNILKTYLDTSKVELSLQTELIRKLDIESEQEKMAKQGHTLPAEIKIHPLKGVPISKIPIGELIYVKLGDYPKELEKIAELLKNRRDQSGLIPAQLISRQITEAGTLSLMVRFASNAYGKIRCGKDVNILVPESTAAGKPRGMNSGKYSFTRLITENWPITLTIIAVLMIIIIFILIAGV